ncbi:hypothetical protein AAH994_12055 [Weeksellaceae bacterium A-14]
MMKFLTVFLMMFAVEAYSQNRDAVAEQFMDYSQLMIRRDFEKAVDLYASDALLKKVSREELTAMMQKMFSSPDVSFTVYLPENVEVLPQFERLKGITYSILAYTQQIDLKLPEEKRAQHDAIVNVLKKEFGSQNVVYHPDEDVYQIITAKKAVAGSRDLQHWKFTVADKNAGYLLREIYPEKVLKLLN